MKVEANNSLCADTDIKMRQRVITGCASAVGCEIIYGLSYIFTKSATEKSSAFSLLGWRFLLAFVAMSILAFLGIIKINFKDKSKKPLVLVAFFSPVCYFVGETYGISNTTASESGIFLASIPVFSLLASALILHKKPSKREVIGILTTMAGVSLTILSAGVSSSLSFKGYAFLLLAVFSYILYCIFVVRASGYSCAEITYIMLLAGALVFVTLALIESAVQGNFKSLITLPMRERPFLLAVLFEGIVCSILAFLMSNVAISHIGINRTSSFVGVSTVTSIVAGALILGERFTTLQIIGAIIIIAGVYIANATKRRRKVKAR